MPRLFFAAAVPAALAAEIAALQQHLRRRGYRGSFPDPAGLHLTFAFLGEVPEQHIPALTRLLEATAAATPPSALWLSRWGRFGPPGEPHVLWVGPGRVPGVLRGLQRQLEAGAAAIRAVPAADPRPWQPHITVLRPRPPVPSAPLPPWRPRRLAVTAIGLYLSQATPGGRRYTLLAAAGLGGDPTPADDGGAAPPAPDRGHG